jgi:hypothetical protein
LGREMSETPPIGVAVGRPFAKMVVGMYVQQEP